MNREQLAQWAGHFVGREMTCPKTKNTGTVVRFVIGEQGNGAWFHLDNGERVYRAPKQQRKRQR